MKRTARLVIALALGVLLAGPVAATHAQSVPPTTDAFDCFTLVWQQTRGGVDNPDQAVQQDAWKRLISCRGRVAALADLNPCWALVVEARPLIEQAAALYDADRSQRAKPKHAGDPPGPFEQAQPLLQHASQLTFQALQCAEAARDKRGRERRAAAAPPPVMLAARAAADAIAAGEVGPRVLDPLRRAQLALPPDVARPIDCWDMMVDAQSKRITSPDYAVRRAQQAVACYEGRLAATSSEGRGMPRRAGTSSRPAECAVLPLPADLTRQLDELKRRTASAAAAAAKTGAGFLSKMAYAMGGRVGMYVRAGEDIATVSPYQLPFTLADPGRRERIASRLLAIYAFAADTTDNIRVGYQFMDRHPKESAWILYRGAVQAVQDIDREVQAIGQDPTRAGPIAGRAVVDTAVAGACAWGGRLLMASEEVSTVEASVAKLERIETVFEPAGVQMVGTWRPATAASDEFVDLWHGSRSNAAAIQRDGFEFRPDSVTYFGSSREAAQNAITGSVDPATDPGIFRIRIPRELWNGAAANGHVFERPYAGFGTVLQGIATREYRINTAAMIDLINRFRERVR